MPNSTNGHKTHPSKVNTPVQETIKELHYILKAQTFIKEIDAYSDVHGNLNGHNRNQDLNDHSLKVEVDVICSGDSSLLPKRTSSSEGNSEEVEEAAIASIP